MQKKWGRHSKKLGRDNLNKNIILKTKRLNIREFTFKDSKKVLSMGKEKGIKKWMPDQVYSDIEQTKNVLDFLIAQYDVEPDPYNKPYELGIELKANKELIGQIGLSAIDEGVEIGYAITDKYQKKGLASEVVTEFSKWTTNNLSIKSIWGVVNKNNEGSVKVLEKSNYKYVEERGDQLLYIYE